jgi:hypothetical protein
MGESVRELILDSAYEEAGVWELAMGHSVVWRGGRTIKSPPPPPVAHIRPVLGEVLRGGQVALRDGRDSNTLSLQDALEVISGDTVWSPPAEPDWNRYRLMLTDSGDAEHAAICERRANEEDRAHGRKG